MKCLLLSKRYGKEYLKKDGELGQTLYVTIGKYSKNGNVTPYNFRVGCQVDYDSLIVGGDVDVDIYPGYFIDKTTNTHVDVYYIGAISPVSANVKA